MVGNTTVGTTVALKKSLSFVDLVQQIQTILPINKNHHQRSLSFLDLRKTNESIINSNNFEEKNPRKLSTRRASKTFRKFPEIVIHPPENVTASMPDITKKIDFYPLNNCNINENNRSCPDLFDETIYAISNQLKPFRNYYEETVEHLKFAPKFNAHAQQKLASNSITIKRKTPFNPSLMLKHKLKQSVSMHNLFHAVVKNSDFDNYHTVHTCSGLNHRKKSIDSDNKNKSEVIYKCCCGMTSCKAVVPIQQYLETYFDKRVSEQKNCKQKKCTYTHTPVVLGWFSHVVVF